ncbi:MAG: chitobiase/beta-hexosaminidase C-terminal domain-containing protein [Candidatus Cloacimonetes bacterium]|nr:chitobiase/beta-hexosaminidase C-terminal domain-containing protein [Candidatus Cloacimonadota bacterium]
MRERMCGFMVLIIISLLVISCSEKTTEPENRVSTPEFDPPAGIYSPPLFVAITCETEGVIIRYTTDGSMPTSSSSRYTEPIEIITHTQLRAVAFKFGWKESFPGNAYYEIYDIVPDAIHPSEGDGTEENPYQIATLENLYWISANSDKWSKHYMQTADIDASATSDWFDEQGWLPIGWSPTDGRYGCFTGTYDGQGYTIEGLYSNRSEMNGNGLLGIVRNASIQNLFMTNVDITGDWYVGGLAAMACNSEIINCHVSGVVNGTRCVGGLVGSAYFYSRVSDSSSSAYVNGDVESGGLIGRADFSIVENSYSKGIVEGNRWIGGLVGTLWYSSIVNSYCTGDVTGDSVVGGLVGMNGNVSLITNCYSTGSVTGEEDTGGLVGITSEGVVVESFWDFETSGQTESSGGEGKSTEEMKTESTYTDVGWDFDTIWSINGNINEGYPYLQSNLPN